jgi:hypothetical protein
MKRHLYNTASEQEIQYYGLYLICQSVGEGKITMCRPEFSRERQSMRGKKTRQAVIQAKDGDGKYGEGQSMSR